MTMQLLITGVEEAVAQEADATLHEQFDLRLTPRASVQVEITQRGQGQEVPLLAEDDDLVELEYNDGGREWMRVDALRRRLGQEAQTRGAETGLRVPLTPPGVAPVATRGRGEALLRRLKLFALDRDGFVNQTAADIIQHFDAKLDPEPGLYPVDPAGKLGARLEQPPAATDQPLLILLHGTFSSILGTFSSLFGTYEWEQLCQIYRGRIYALEHRTLNQSPMDNALALVKLLPDGAKLHLVSHSRGGLIGEVLVLQALTADDRSAFRLAGREGQLAVLEEVLAIVKQKGVQVECFVRVACPANGTLLAAENFDRFLSVILNLVGGLADGVTGGALEPLAAYVKATVLTLIQKRSDPATLPGLEAMMPKSPLMRLLNLGRHTSPSELAVIAGDTTLGLSSWPSLAAIVAEFIFAEDHDLVVNTSSMDRGITRRKGVYVFSEQSPQTHHFHYFHNQTTRDRIYAWLKHEGTATVDDFIKRSPEVARAETQSRAAAAAPAADAPSVILIPGLLATQLNVGDQTLWLDMAALATGQIDQLALGKEPDADNKVTLGAIFPNIYQPLQDALATRYHVAAFPYDWRKSLRDAAEQLAARIEAELQVAGRPLHLVAHSTGGLVARALLVYAPSTWTKLCNRGGRLIMLGTPQHGTYAALDLLSGQAALMQMLALLDPRHPVSALSTLFWNFPGLVELLPQDTESWLKAWASADTAKLRSKTQIQTALKKAQRVWDKLTQAIDPVHMRQVLGNAPWTPNGLQVDATNRLVFQGAGEGDGVVTTQQGALAGVPTWYVNAAHANLCNPEVIFPALKELIEQGQTTLLGQTPLGQAQRGSTQLRAVRLVGFPNATELTAAALGSDTQAVLKTPSGPAMVLHVSVTHASLEYAAYPVAVGHYHSDLITGTEGALDWRLDGKLSKRRAMNIYPGRAGEAEVILLPHNAPPGALVIGLGEIGELTADIVTRGITEAVLRLALTHYETTVKAQDPDATPLTNDVTLSKRPEPLLVGFSALLIGVRGGRALTIENSVAAIVTGALQANRSLAAQKLAKSVYIDKIEFVEIYEEYAIRAAHAVRNLKQYLRLPLAADEDLALEKYLRRGEGGFVGQPATEYEGWWRRLQISEKKDPEAKGTGELEFLLLTDRARAELTLQATQRSLVEQLVARTIKQSNAANDLTLPTTLYELLLPNNLKTQPLDTSDLLLIVDNLSAQYPWEMLADRRPGEQTITSSQQLRPLSVRRGIIRQLTTGAYRTLVQPARGDKALVIGEPQLDPVHYPEDANYPPLPGARAEAEAVAAILTERGYQVTKLIQADALTIIQALFAADYQIIHIAGHGIYKPSAPAQSGVVLGGNLFLTAAEIGQLRVVPEMVFLNCCHLGQMDGEMVKPADGLEQTQRAWNQLAASISQELIKIGVRAVVAAGWAVNDSAAQAFAEQLYGLMLPVSTKGTQGNLQFGEAVCSARNYIYEKVNTPPNNTWGAYQCYGDPGFMLNPMAHPTRTLETNYVAPSEILRELRNQQARAARLENSNRRASLKQAVQGMEAQLPATWRDGEMLYALGETYAELGDFPQAITHYRDAMKASSPNERVPIRAIEQLANLEARYAQELMNTTQRGQSETTQDTEWNPDALLKKAEKRLLNLNELAATPERKALLGSCYKRRAMLVNGDARRKILQKAVTSYQKAAELAKTNQKSEFYHILNQVTCQFLSEEHIADSTRQALLKTLEADETGKVSGAEPDFWKRVATADRELAHSLLQGTIAENELRIQGLYTKAFDVGATIRQWATVIAHIEFVSVMLEGRDAPAAAVLRTLCMKLKG